MKQICLRYGPVVFAVWLVLVPLVQPAANDDAPRLFRPPINLENPSPSNSKEELAKPPASKRAGFVANSYRYDGFVSSRGGNIYLVNGVPLFKQEGLTLIAVLQDGSKIDVRTKGGKVLRIGIGQTVEGRK